MKKYHTFLLLLVFLASCSSNSNLTSFGNRKYTKGYFLNSPGEKSVVVANVTQAEFKAKIEQLKPVSSPLSIRQLVSSPKWQVTTLRKSNLTQKKSEAQKRAIIINEQVRSAENTFNKQDDSNDSQKTSVNFGKALLIGAVALVLLYIIFWNISSLMILVLLLAIVSLFLGILIIRGAISFSKKEHNAKQPDEPKMIAPVPNSDGYDPPPRNGLYGLLFILAAILMLWLGGTFTSAVIVGGPGVVPYLVIGLFLILFAIVLFIVGLVYLIKALINLIRNK